LSRAQKIAFKTRFKEEFDSKWFMPLNFFLSYAIYIIIMIIFNFIQNNKLKSYLIDYDKNQGKIALFRDNSQSENLVEDEELDDNNSKSYIEKKQEGDKIKNLIKNLDEQRISGKIKEKFIFSCIFIENFLSLCLSIAYKILTSNSNSDNTNTNPNDINTSSDKKEKELTSDTIICYLSILISGSINFILTEYYSSQKIEYFSLSGIICFSQVIFRIVELIHSLNKDDKWIYFQIAVSFLGCIISFFSNDIIKKILKKRKKLIN